MKLFRCDGCGQTLFFESTTCIRCDDPLLYLPEAREMVPARARPEYRLCENGTAHGACNWAVPADAASPYCRACALNDTIPDLSVAGSLDAWRRLESAKRRLLFTLFELGLPVANRVEDPERGLAFRFLADGPDGPVLTGHAAGVITINVREADDLAREEARVRLGEPYRTLLGHFRHESGHYYFDRLVLARPDRLSAFRARFGDERTAYAESIERYYAEGAPPGWQDAYVTEYASMHPFEDFAESFAHYLHIADTLQTAGEYGMRLDPVLPALDAAAARSRLRHDLGDFDAVVERWLLLTSALNSLNRSMGVPDGYPFVLAPRALEKLRFVHDAISGERAHATDPAQRTLTAAAPA